MTYTFSDLSVGDTFDFINPRGTTTFYATCRKISARCYEYRANTGDFNQSQVHRAQVGSISVNVYHVNEGAI